MANEADKEFNDSAALNASIRAAKRSEKPSKIGDYVPPKGKGKGKHGAGRDAKKRATGGASKVLGKGSKFDRDLGSRGSGGGGGSGGGAAREGMRAKKGDGGILGGKKGGKGKGGGGKPKGRR